MGAYLSLTLSESNIDKTNNKSTVTAVLYVTSNSGTYNQADSCTGTITIDGTAYSFQHYFSANTTTKLATKSKVVTHNSDGSKTVSVSASFKTGTSAGTITTSKSLTLTKIQRSFTVKLYPRGGKIGTSTSMVTKTKKYGTALSLPTPTRTGYTFGGWCTNSDGTGTNYKTSYTKNADISLYAKWTIKSYTLTANANGGSISTTTGWTGSGSKTTKSVNYNAAYGTLPTVKRTGYNLYKSNSSSTGWYTTATSNTNVTSSTKMGTANATIYARWTANISEVTFNANGADSGTVPADKQYTYDTQITIPANPSTGGLEKAYYIFKGWSTNSTAETPQYAPGATYKWQNPNNNVTLYAVWAPDTVRVTYYRNTTEKDFDDPNSYTELNTDNHHKSEDYTLGVISAPDLLNYTFSGYWTLNKPNNIVYTEYGVSFPAGILPHDYDLNDLTQENGFYKSGNTIEHVLEPLNFYPVYIDNTKSLVSLYNSTYNYISNDIDESMYFAYISNQLSTIPVLTVSPYVAIGSIFRTEVGASGVSINIGSAELQSLDSETSINVKSIVKSVYDSELDITNIYVIYKNTSELVDYNDAEYRLTISNITDSFGKEIPNVVVNIYPPKVLRDINAKGDVISFFTEAPDYTESHFDKEILVNGDIAVGLFKYDEQDNTNLDTQIYEAITRLGWTDVITEVTI